jgi:hypothetical protein
MSMTMKRGDLEPALVLTVEDVAGVADLRNVVSWRILGKQRGLLVVDGAPDLAVVDAINESKAVLTRAWQGTETVVVGDMYIEVEAMWPGSRRQTFPASSYEMVRIVADLG